MRGFTTTSTLAEMINKRPMRKRRNVKKKEKEEAYQKIKRQEFLKNTFQVLKALKDRLELN